MSGIYDRSLFLCQIRGVVIRMKMLWIVLVVFILIQGCANHPSYYPEETSIAFFKEAGESQLAFSKNGIERGYSATAALALSNDIFLLGKYSISRHGNCDSCSTHKRDYTEGAVGVSKLISSSLGDELLIGFGRGKIISLESAFVYLLGSGCCRATSEYFRPYVQYNLGVLKTNRLLSVISLRGSYVYNRSYLLEDFLTNQSVASPGRNWSAFIEPAATLKGVLGGFSLHAQVGASVPLLTGAEFNSDWMWVSAGAGYRFSLF